MAVERGEGGRLKKGSILNPEGVGWQTPRLPWRKILELSANNIEEAYKILWDVVQNSKKGSVRAAYALRIMEIHKPKGDEEEENEGVTGGRFKEVVDAYKEVNKRLELSELQVTHLKQQLFFATQKPLYAPQEAEVVEGTIPTKEAPAPSEEAVEEVPCGTSVAEESLPNNK